MPVNNLIQLRRGDDWGNNPVLSGGEPGLDSNYNIFKIGDGITAWSGLAPANFPIANSGDGIKYNGTIWETDSLIAHSGNNISIFVNDSGYIQELSQDLTPQLGGNLDINTYSITGIGNINIDGNIIANYFYSNISGTLVTANSGNFIDSLTVNGLNVLVSGDNISLLNNDTGYISDIIQDITPQLGGNLDLNQNNIIGTGNLGISGNITANTGNLDVLSFNVDNDSILTKGQISWDDTQGTLSIGLNGAGHYMAIGESRFFRVRNDTGSDLYKGQVVYATGVHANGLISPAKFIANGTIDEIRFIGVVFYDISNNNNGYVVDFGQVRDLDLDGSVSNYAVGDETWLAGDILYAHPTVAGKLTKVEPKDAISVAIILDTGNGNGNGKMFVRPNNFGHLSDNHDVNVSGVTNGQFLQYNSATDYWVPSSSGNFTTLQVNGTAVPTGVGTSNYITKWTGINSISTGVIYDDGTNVGIGTASPSYKLEVNGDIGLTDSGFYASPTGVMVGTSGWLYNDGQTTLSHGNFSDNGDAQNSSYVLRTSTTNATFTTIANNGSSIRLSNNRTFMFTANIVARRTNGQDNAAYKLEGIIANDGYGASTLGTPVKTILYESDSSWDVQAIITSINVGSDTSDDLLIQAKGAASKNINWVCKLDLLEAGGDISGYTEANTLNIDAEIIP